MHVIIKEKLFLLFTGLLKIWCHPLRAFPQVSAVFYNLENYRFYQMAYIKFNNNQYYYLNPLCKSGPVKL